MKFLFLKRSLRFPRTIGHDVHTWAMMRALGELGHEVDLALVEEPSESAWAGLHLGHPPFRLSDGPVFDEARLTTLQRRYLRYWGIDPGWIGATSRLMAEMRPDVVVAASLEVVPCLAAVGRVKRVWYAADEYVRHHLTQFRLGSPRTWRQLQHAVISGGYERVYARYMDRIWVVSAEEQRAMRRVTGLQAVDVVANGVDADYFAPGGETPAPETCVFWGRLDARPNVEAVVWFVTKVWPLVRMKRPKAQFLAVGFHPAPEVLALQGNGVVVVPDVADLRPTVRGNEVAVMPFISGAGIKNKLLEAAAMAMPIIASRQACVGLDATHGLPLLAVHSLEQWEAALTRLWGGPAECRRLGNAARDWVRLRHSWSAAAHAALRGLLPTRVPEGVA